MAFLRWLMTIVGVVGSVRGNALGAKPTPLMYRRYCQTKNPFLTQMSFIVRMKGDPRAGIRPVEGQVMQWTVINRSSTAKQWRKGFAHVGIRDLCRSRFRYGVVGDAHQRGLAYPSNGPEPDFLGFIGRFVLHSP